jgi:hypothetical protein
VLACRVSNLKGRDRGLLASLVSQCQLVAPPFVGPVQPEAA